MSDEHLDHATSDVKYQTSIESQELNIVSILKPSIKKYGNQWCVLYGDNLQEGIAGFGDTPHEAVLDFNDQWYERSKPT